jgi:hypothetical protein
VACGASGAFRGLKCHQGMPPAARGPAISSPEGVPAGSADDGHAGSVGRTSSGLRSGGGGSSCCSGSDESGLQPARAAAARQAISKATSRPRAILPVKGPLHAPAGRARVRIADARRAALSGGERGLPRAVRESYHVPLCVPPVYSAPSRSRAAAPRQRSDLRVRRLVCRPECGSSQAVEPGTLLYCRKSDTVTPRVCHGKLKNHVAQCHALACAIDPHTGPRARLVPVPPAANAPRRRRVHIGGLRRAKGARLFKCDSRGWLGAHQGTPNQHVAEEACLELY